MKRPGIMLLLAGAATCASGCVRTPPAAPNPITERRIRREQAAVFVRLGCSECHAVAALGVAASADVAPDLTYAYGDVVNRYGVSLESFLAHPTGVMRLMLASHLDLSVPDRDAIVRILHQLHEQRRADASDPARRLPAGAQAQP